MDEQTYQERVARLKKVNEVVSGLDEAIRAAAFSILKPYVTGKASADDHDEEEGNPDPDPAPAKGGAGAKKPLTGFDLLIEKHESDKDSENAMLALAIFNARHGRSPFQMSQIKAVADDFNLTLPKRLDKFFERAKRDGTF